MFTTTVQRPSSTAAGRRLLLLASVLLVSCIPAGCSRRLTLVPLKGTVYLNDKPLPFGTVMFQPASGPPARGIIQPDGTFDLTTDIDGDGATVGTNRIRVTCFEGQGAPDTSQGEHGLGRLLIPRRYTNYATSQLTIEVAADAPSPVELRLVD